ncbi:hypothetical protein LBMAG42_23470 [Deltaproteobacteria bacterium]|nr:hypothetical protein LBMAG42_23470 [Deltaproteobacteria bacterium]
MLRPWIIAIACSGCAVEGWPAPGSDRESAPERTPAATLEGRVGDASGAPIAGAHVTTIPGGVEATTDADGNWQIGRVIPESYTLVIIAPGFAAQSIGPIAAAAGESVVTDAVLSAAVATNGVVRVRVVGPEGLPVEGAVAMATDGATTVSGTTDSAGHALLAGLAGLSVDVSVEDPSGRLGAFATQAVAVPTTGGVDVAASLAGIPAASAVFVGSEACRLCHPDAVSDAASTAHANALTGLTGAPADAFLGSTTVSIGSASALLSTVDGVATVTLTDATGASDTWPVSGFIGGEARGAVPWAERSGTAWPLPVAWVAPDPARPGFVDSGWVVGDTAPWLDGAGAFAYSGTPDVATSAEANCFGCHATGFTLSENAGVVSMAGVTITGARWDEAGVGCEACHGPGSEHVNAVAGEGPATITNPAHLDAERANDVCSQCHDARIGNANTPYAWSATDGMFAPGDDIAGFGTSAFISWSSGAAKVPHAQGGELSLSKHTTAGWDARCSDCHTSHGGGFTAETRQSAADNSLCLGCHSTLSFEGSLELTAAHTGHPVYVPETVVEEGRCVGCHMPSTAAQLVWSNESGAGDLRSHRMAIIAPSATVADFAAAGATELPAGEFIPNACQECHAWNDVVFSGYFPGPTGDMTQLATHELLDEAYQGMFP